jgi:GDSL-like Lipase/Acylhydrolase family/Carbohydrate esterase 2 N-terminal
MKNKLRSLAVFLFLFSTGFCPPDPGLASHDQLDAASLRPAGRFLMSSSGHLELIGSAVHFGFQFTGVQCAVYAYLTDSAAHGYLQYELDGIYQKRLRVAGNDKRPVMIVAPAQGTHVVWIYKATEASTGSIFIEKITGNGLQALPIPAGPLIEFIGNSITCGAAADPSETPCGLGSYQDQHNAYYAYGPRVARALGMNFLLSSVSGIGIYRNWNSDGPTMPQVYANADFQLTSNRLWDFSRYQPRIVSIALGTNDFSNGDGQHQRLPFDSALFVSTYIKFVQLLKSKYPSARIALLSSPMINGEKRITLQNCLKAVKTNIDGLYPSGKPVATFFFEPMQASGCSGHPSVAEHAILAQELLPFFKNLLSTR